VRVVKSDAEIKFMKAAAQITELGMKKLLMLLVLE
jgi:Xaa-Pro aminopeptidase